MFFFVLFFFQEPQGKASEKTPSIAEVARNFCVVMGNARLIFPVLGVGLLLFIFSEGYHFAVPWWIWLGLFAITLAGLSRFMWFLLLFSGFWIVMWQQYISLPGYIHSYVDPNANIELILVTDSAVVISLTLVVNFLTRKIPVLQAVILGTLITSCGWLILTFWNTVTGAVLSLVVLAIGEVALSPRYYEYCSRLAPPEQQGLYMGFALLPVGIGSFVGGWLGGRLLHHFGEVTHQPARMWPVITIVGLGATVLLWVYDKTLKPAGAVPEKDAKT